MIDEDLEIAMRGRDFWRETALRSKNRVQKLEAERDELAEALEAVLNPKPMHADDWQTEFDIRARARKVLAKHGGNNE